MILDLFAGMGGWSEGLRSLGLTDLGIEWNTHAAATRRANGHDTIEASVLDLRPEWFRGTTGLIASPPCPPFSQANGNAKGIDDPRGMLMFTAAAWVHELVPEWVLMENTPKAKALFEQIAEGLATRGYSTHVQVVNAADHGVAQSRKRCILMASLAREVGPIAPTVQIHRTMAEALWSRDDLPRWAYERPSTTVVGSFRPEVIAAPGWRKAGDGPRQNQPDSVVTSEFERLVLQSFPQEYRLCGPKTARARQIGDALPPMLATALVRHVTGNTLPVPAALRAA